MLVFALWYYLPSNQLLRGRDVCSYYSIKSNQTCFCLVAQGQIQQHYFPNGSSITLMPTRNRNIQLPNVTG